MKILIWPDLDQSKKQIGAVRAIQHFEVLVKWDHLGLTFSNHLGEKVIFMANYETSELRLDGGHAEIQLTEVSDFWHDGLEHFLKCLQLAEDCLVGLHVGYSPKRHRLEGYPNQMEVAA